MHDRTSFSMSVVSGQGKKPAYLLLFSGYGVVHVHTFSQLISTNLRFGWRLTPFVIHSKRAFKYILHLFWRSGTRGGGLFVSPCKKVQEHFQNPKSASYGIFHLGQYTDMTL